MELSEGSAYRRARRWLHLLLPCFAYPASLPPTSSWAFTRRQMPKVIAGKSAMEEETETRRKRNDPKPPPKIQMIISEW